MVFTEPLFLFLFLPCTLLCYWLAPIRWKNPVLLIASLAFYGLGQLGDSGILLGSIALNAVAGFFLATVKSSRLRASVVVAGVGANLIFLGWFKYADFIVRNVGAAMESVGMGALPLPEVALPVGISFFTFQAISYLIDVKRGDARAARGPFDLALYIALFPQLVAGPIVRFTTIAEAIRSRHVDVADIEQGSRRFVIGLAKKVLVANSVAAPVDAIFGLPADQLSASLVWLASALYAIQIYFDFSGYSDMAIGLGRLFGFRFDENFNYPYISRSITDFWRRWHISLSTWFRDYLYIPLGGNRRGPVRTYFNLAVVFLLCGLWHGASWLFVLWGAYQGFFLIVERAVLGRWLQRTPALLQHAYALVVIIVGWTIFRAATGPNGDADSVSYLVTCLKAMCGLHSAEHQRSIGEFLEPITLIAAIAGIITSIPIAPLLTERSTRAGSPWGVVGRVFEAVLLIGLFMLSVICSASNAYNPFIYFQF